MTFPSYLTTTLFHIGGKPITPISLLGAIASVIIAIGLGRVAARMARRFLERRSGVTAGTAYASSRIVQYTVMVVGVLIGFDTAGFSLSSLAAFGTFLSVGVGFGLQNIVQNFVCGLILLVERPVKKGDFVRIGDVSGTVDEIAMRATRVLTRDGVAVFVPNSELITGRLVNQSAPTTDYRVRIAVGAAYGSDTGLVRDVLLQIAAEHPKVLTDSAPYVFFRDFGDSALMFELCVWLNDPHEEPVVTSELRFAIDAAFRAAAIEIPFPQRDVHVRSGLAPPLAGAARPQA